MKRLPQWLQGNNLDIDRLFSQYRLNTAVLGPDYSFTYEQFGKKLKNICAGMAQLGVWPGATVGLYASHGPMHLFLLMASFCQDFIFLPLNTQIPVKKACAGLRPDFLVSEEETASAIPEAISCRRLWDMSDSVKEFSSIMLSQKTSVIFTSGSTGTPKGVVHTVGNYIYSALGTVEFYKMNTGDSWLLTLPLYHVGGLLIFLRTLVSGATCIIPENMKNVEDALRKNNPSFVSLVPTQLIRMLESEESVNSLCQCRAVLLGGAPAPRWLIETCYHKGMALSSTYGATETCAQLTATKPGSAVAHLLTAGKVLPYRKVKTDVSGRILAGGKTLFSHYIPDESGNAGVSDGWFAMPDIGVLDKENNLIVTGRADQVFISGGENISPGQVEKAIREFDGITDAIVVPVPDREFGNVGWAFIISMRPVDTDELRTFLKTMLPAYMVPKHIEIISAENYTAGLKIDRKGLAKKARKMAEKKGEDK